MSAKNSGLSYTYDGSPPSRIRANITERCQQFCVIPAKAGIHGSLKNPWRQTVTMGPRLRGDDGRDAMLAHMRLRGDDAAACFPAAYEFQPPDLRLSGLRQVDRLIERGDAL
jgi:hypothetical protein